MFIFCQSLVQQTRKTFAYSFSEVINKEEKLKFDVNSFKVCKETVEMKKNQNGNGMT